MFKQENAIYSHRSYTIQIFVSCLYTTMYRDTLWQPGPVKSFQSGPRMSIQILNFQVTCLPSFKPTLLRFLVQVMPGHCPKIVRNVQILGILAFPCMHSIKADYFTTTSHVSCELIPVVSVTNSRITQQCSIVRILVIEPNSGTVVCQGSSFYVYG